MIQFKFPYIDVLNYQFNTNQVKTFPRKIADKFSAIILDEHGDNLTLALPNPEDSLEDLTYSLKIRKIIEELESIVNKKILIFISNENHLKLCINREYKRRTK